MPGDVTTLAIAALLADEIEKLGKALFIASLVAKDICEHLAAKNPLQMIVEDGHIARQPAFEREMRGESVRRNCRACQA